jgi:SnoaL-like domain
VREDVAVTPEEARVIAEDWIGAWNAHDLDRIGQHYADDVVLRAPTVVTRWDRPDGCLRGKTEVMEHFRRGLELAPDLHFYLEAVLGSPDGFAVVYERENGHLVADTVVVDESGRAAEVRVYSVDRKG